MNCQIFKNESSFLFFVLIISFVLNIYGINWGLPACWNTDQSVTTSLNMLKNNNLIPEDYLHPSFYYYVLLIFIVPYLISLYLFYPQFSSFLCSSKVSWNYMAINYPDIATGIFIFARLSSVLFSLITVWLVYRIGKLAHSEKAGVFSALILALTMDFVNWAHIEKSVALVNMLIVASIYYAILFLKEAPRSKMFLTSCFLGGLAVSVKFNGGISFLIIAMVAILSYFFKENKALFRDKCVAFFKMFVPGVAVYILTFLLTSPGIILKANKFFIESSVEYKDKFLPTNGSVFFKICFGNLIGIADTLTQMFGIPFALLIGGGVVYVIFKYCRRSLVFAGFVSIPLVTVGFLILSPRVFSSANSKFIAQITPILAIIGGIFTADILNYKCSYRVGKLLKIVILALIFSISFFYCFALDRIFICNDIRYTATKWILENIQYKSDLIVVNQLEYSLGIDVLKYYNVYVLGDSPGTKGSYSFINKQYGAIDEKELDKINRFKSVYIIRPCWQLRHRYACPSFPMLEGDLKLLKVFERNSPWYWRPSLGGYETSSIEIYEKIFKD